MQLHAYIFEVHYKVIEILAVRWLSTKLMHSDFQRDSAKSAYSPARILSTSFLGKDGSPVPSMNVLGGFGPDIGWV